MKLLILALLALTTTSHALSNEEVMAKLATISTEPDVSAKVATIFAHDEARISGCKDVQTPVPTQMTVFETPQFSTEFLETGTWQIRYDVASCGQNRQRTALFQVKNGENLSITSLLPGNTLADMNLQADARQSFFMGVAKLAPDCSTPHIIQTQVTQNPTDSDSPWQEIWTADFCNKKIAQVINFQPNAQGTGFTLSAIE